jgi:branched-chain amino acid transport system substrate-binding protein
LGLIGHYNSGQTLAAMEIYKDLPIVVITPTASELSITQRGYRNFFRVNANDAVQADVDAQFLVEELGAQRVAIVHNDTEYGIGLAEQMQRALGERDAEAVLVTQVAEGQEQYDKEVSQIQDAAPNAIFYAGYEIEAPFLRLAVTQAGIDLPFLASDGALLTATIDDADGTADGMYVSGFAPSPQQVADPEWIDLYREVEFRNPDTYSVNGYVAMRVLAAGVEQAESFDAGTVSDAIRNNTVDTAIGQLNYVDNGDLENATIYIFEVKGDRFEQTYPQRSGLGE